MDGVYLNGLVSSPAQQERVSRGQDWSIRQWNRVILKAPRLLQLCQDTLTLTKCIRVETVATMLDS
eukprot:1544464-Amphidinium_carterae.1